jgi:phosphoribosylanthranilate isomerase
MTGDPFQDARIARILQRGNLVKIDGLRQPEHAAAAAAAGADLIGFIFAPARRRVAPNTAGDCVAVARAAASGREFLAVGVFVDANPDEIREMCSQAELDLAQLHGAETPQYVTDLGVPVIKALRPRPGTHAAEVIADIDRFNAGPTPPVAFLIDGYDGRAAGGTGTRADWALVAEIAQARPVFLAGGLDATNVAEAIHTVRPVGVDVSSGVETDGTKDADLIEAFIHAARAAFRE